MFALFLVNGDAKRINAVILSSTNGKKNKLMSFHCGRAGELGLTVQSQKHKHKHKRKCKHK